jgi:hypothetical protein
MVSWNLSGLGRCCTGLNTDWRSGFADSNPEWLGRSSCKRKAQSLRCQVREHRGDKKQGKDISVEVMDMHRINYGLGCHDQPVRDA